MKIEVQDTRGKLKGKEKGELKEKGEQKKSSDWVREKGKERNTRKVCTIKQKRQIHTTK